MSGPSSDTWLAGLWLAGVVGASVVYRRARGKPVLFFGIRGAQFLERFASGFSHDTWYTRLGGASNCLVVAVSERRLIVRPWFPFNMLFLPEIYALEHEIPLAQVMDVSVTKWWGHRRVVVRCRDSENQERALSLFLRSPERLMDVLQVRSESVGSVG